MTFILATNIVLAQNNDSCYTGVYLNKEDFLKNHLSYRINQANKHEKLLFTFPADLTLTLKIVKHDSVMKFKPGSIYGYFECGDVYRYSPGTELNALEDYYKIEDVKGLILYSSLFLSGKETFYSLDLTSPIHRLTKINLEKDFKDYPQFIKAIKKPHKNFKGDLATRDNKGAFVINKIYRKTISGNNRRSMGP
jgi:hypothetical protein